MNATERLAAMGLTLPPPPEPVGRFVPAVRTGNLMFLSGLAPTDENGKPIVGRVGQDFTAEEARAFARRIGLALLSTMEAQLGSLDKVSRIVKVFGIVNATPDFMQHPHVIDGCSTLFFDVFGEPGNHARTAVGAGSLPSGIPVEIEAVIEID